MTVSLTTACWVPRTKQSRHITTCSFNRQNDFKTNTKKCICLIFIASLIFGSQFIMQVINFKQILLNLLLEKNIKHDTVFFQGMLNIGNKVTMPE